MENPLPVAIGSEMLMLNQLPGAVVVAVVAVGALPPLVLVDGGAHCTAGLSVQLLAVWVLTCYIRKKGRSQWRPVCPRII